MLRLSIPQRIQLLEMRGHIVLMPTPFDLEEMWTRARDTGCRVGQLYIVSAPLAARATSGYLRDTGDAWLLAHDDPAKMRYHLLLILAHACREANEPQTVDEDWDAERATLLEAQALVAVLGTDDLIPDDVLEAQLERVEQLRCHHHEAAMLAGSSDPRIVRAAYLALCDIADERRWDDATFDLALSGVHDDEAINSAIIDFDRACMRGTWSIGMGEGGNFGAYTLPQGERSADLLRYALRQVAQGNHARPLRTIEQGEYRWRGGFLTLDSDFELSFVLAAANTALLAYQRGSALANWHLYADQPGLGHARLYRLTVRYDDQGSAKPDDTDIWILVVPTRERTLCAEAALQRYIASWLRVQQLRVESLEDGYAYGLTTLWGHLATR
jgi:hypothetical protein